MAAHRLCHGAKLCLFDTRWEWMSSIFSHWTKYAAPRELLHLFLVFCHGWNFFSCSKFHFTQSDSGLFTDSRLRLPFLPFSLFLLIFVTFLPYITFHFLILPNSLITRTHGYTRSLIPNSFHLLSLTHILRCRTL